MSISKRLLLACLVVGMIGLSACGGDYAGSASVHHYGGVYHSGFGYGGPWGGWGGPPYMGGGGGGVIIGGPIGLPSDPIAMPLDPGFDF